MRIADGGDGTGDGFVGHGFRHELIDVLSERGRVVRWELRHAGLERVERWPKDGVIDRSGGLSQGDGEPSGHRGERAGAAGECA